MLPEALHGGRLGKESNTVVTGSSVTNAASRAIGGTRRLADWRVSNLSDRAARIVELCQGRRVLHVGCADQLFTEQKLTDGTLLHAIVAAVAGECYGVDQSAEGVALLERHGYRNLAVGSIEELVIDRRFGDTRFDVVLAGEVLEHVSDAGSFLLSLRPLLQAPSSLLVLTTPNAYCAHRFVCRMLTGQERVNPDHVAYYSSGTLSVLLTRCGYTLQQLSYYSAREYMPEPRGRARILWLVDRIAFRFRPELGDGLIAVSTLADRPAAGA